MFSYVFTLCTEQMYIAMFVCISLLSFSNSAA